MKRIYITSLILIASSYCYSQSISSSVISTTSLQSTELSCTVGEARIGLYDNSGDMLTDGFNQPKITITKIESDFEKLDVSIFPNPTSDLINISSQDQNLNIRITDLNGKEISDVEMINNQIAVNNFAAGTYILTITNNQNRIGKFKIIKQ